MIAFLEELWGDWAACGATATEIFPDTFPLPALREGL